MDQEEIHSKSLSESSDKRRLAVEQLRYNYYLLPDKKRAWEDLHRLTFDVDSGVRITALEAMRIVFQSLPDKKEAWGDLHRLTLDPDLYVRREATSTLRSTYQYLPEKQDACEDLIKLNSDRSRKVRIGAEWALRNVFQYIPDKEQAWENLRRLTSDGDNDVRSRVASIFGTAFHYIPDKEQAWVELRRLTLDDDNNVRSSAAWTLGITFKYILDKEQAWIELHRLTSDKDNNVRSNSAGALGIAFQYIPDKEQAWVELRRLTLDDDNSVRSSAAMTLGTAFQYIPDKKQAWKNLRRLISDEDIDVRSIATWTLGIAFQHIPDKKQAWENLHRLTSDKQFNLRRNAQWAVATAFKYIPEKNQAWSSLYLMKADKDHFVRQMVAQTLGNAIQYTPHKKKAWEDLRSLILDEDYAVRMGAAQEFGTAFRYAPDIKCVLEELHSLILDENSSVRANAYYSLGKFSIYEASQSESDETYIEKLKNAIMFFEKASNEDRWCHPSNFCLPFYRSFYAIISNEEQLTKDEVEKYLAEAKEAIGASENRKLLFEIVENLARALEEVQNLKNMDLEAKKGELNFYRKYCEQAAELMKNTEEAAPFATVTMMKALPIFDKKLKSLLEKIKEKAKTACHESKGTDTEEIACAVSREIQKWEIGNQEEMTWNIENLIFSLESSIPRMPENQHIFSRIQQIREQKDLVKQYGMVSSIIPLIPRLHMEREISDIKRSVDEANEKATIIIKKLDEIQKELKEGFKKLDKLSSEVGGKEGERIRIFSEKLLEMTKKGDSKAIERFLEELIKDEDALTKEIDSSSAPQKEKEESKGSISKLKLLLKKVKNPTKEFGKEVSKEIVVSYAAKGIIDVILPMMFLAVFGVPMPSHITEILAIVAKELKELPQNVSNPKDL